jgi:hypothetical protein
MRAATKRALVFQRHIFKKAWGIYYAVWASTFSIYFFLPSFLSLFGLSTNLGNDYYLLILDLAVSVVAGTASGRIIERARIASFVQSTINRPRPSFFERRKKLFAIWWIVYFSAIIVSAVLFRAHLISIVFGLATTGTIVFYYALRVCFQESIPREGVIAISIFGIASTSSFGISLFNSNSIVYAIIWGVTILVWFGASFYSLLHIDEELTEASLTETMP